MEQTLTGRTIGLSGRFELIVSLKVNNRATDYIKICIVEAKKNDYPKGQAQCLGGMEVLADLEDYTTTYGIVSDFSRWYFLRSDNTNVKIQAYSPFINDFTYEESQRDLVMDQLKHLFLVLYSFFSMIESSHQ